MKFVKGFMLLGLISLIAVSVHPSLSFAEQTQRTAPTLVPSAADTVIQTNEAGPFMLAHWRPRYRRIFERREGLSFGEDWGKRHA
ncbi:MAG: hypothetical protein ACLQPD_24995 [Desulfomonilaceae bacterium]